MTLSGSNTYTGPTAVTGGTLAVSGGYGIGDTSAVTLNNTAGVTLLLNSNETIGSLAGGGSTGGSVNLGGNTLSVGGNNTNTTYSGVISNGSLTKIGSGFLNLNGSAVNTYTGATTVNGGTLNLNFANLATPTNLINSSSALSFNGGGILNIAQKGSGSTSQTFNGTTVNAGGGQVLASLATTTVNLGALNTTASGGSLWLGLNAISNTAPANFNTSSSVDSTGILGGRVVISAVTLFTGADWATVLTNGTIGSYSGYTNLALTAGSDTANSRITGSQTLTGARTTNTLKISDAGNATLALGSNLFTLTGGGLLITGGNYNASPVVISGNAGATTLTAGNGSGSYDLIVQQFNIFGANISAVIGNNGSNAVSLVKAGTGVLTLSGVNTYTGGTYVNSGALVLGATNTLLATGTTQVSSNATMGLAVGTGYFGSADVDHLFANTFSGVNMAVGASVGIDTTAGNFTYATGQAGVSGFLKNGANTLYLTGANTYSGMTTINGGTLDVGTLTGASGTSLSANTGILINNGAILEGNGLFTRNFSNNTTPGAGQISGQSGGFAAKGGQLTVTLNGGGTWQFNGSSYQFGNGNGLVFGSATADSRVLLTNGLDLNGTSLRNIAVNSGVGGDYVEVSGVINDTNVSAPATSGLSKSGTGRLVLSGINTYFGSTVINAGVLQGNEGVGVPTNAFISLNGGVLQSNGAAASFTRTLATSGSTGLFSMGTGGGGWSANGGQYTVNLGGAGAEQVWGSTTGVTLQGTLMFGSVSANNVTVFQNNIDLNSTATTGLIRTINVTAGTLADSGQTGGDYAQITGNIRNSGAATGLTLSGNGKLVLSGSNSYTGQTWISGGKLVVGSNWALGTNPNIGFSNAVGSIDFAGYNYTINNLSGGGALGGNIALGSGTLTLSGVSNTYSGVISGAGGIIRNGASGVQTLAGANTYDGVTTVNNNSYLAITNSSALGSLVGNTIVSGTTGGTGSQLQVSGNISVAEALTISGEGPGWTGALDNTSGTNTWSGAITIGTANARINGVAGTLNVTGGITSATNLNLIVSPAIAGAAINITNAPINIGTGTMMIDGGAANLQASGTVGLGVGGNTIGTLQITYGGILQALAANVLPTSVIEIATGTATGTGTGTLDLNGFNQSIGIIRTGANALNQSGTRSITNTSATAATLTVNQTIASTYDGQMTGALSLVKNGAATFILSGSDTYTGTTTVNSGTLQIGAGGTVGNLTATSVTGSSGATLAFNHSDTVSFAPVISGGLGVLQVGNGAIAASNVLALSGSNSYTGLTTIRNGVLRLDNVNALGSTSGIQLGDASTIAGNNQNSTYAVLQLNVEGGVFSQNVSNWVSSGSASTGQGRVRITASTNATLSGNVLLADSAGAATVITELSAFAGKTLTLSGIISGTGATGRVFFNGGGVADNTSTVRLTNGANNFNSVVAGSMISRGTVISAVQGALGGAGTISMLDGSAPTTGAAVALLTEGNQTISNAISLANTSNLLGDSYTVGVNNASNATFSGNISALAYLTTATNQPRNFIVTAADSGTATFTGSFTENPALPISGSATASMTALTKTGNGTTVIGGAWGYTGATTVSQGTLQIGNGGAAGSIASTSGVSGSSGATLAFNRSDAFSFDSVISGGVALTQIGSGTTTLSQANTYTGATTVNSGALFINGDNTGATGALTVNSGKLAVNGLTGVNSVVTVNAGGALVGSGLGVVGGTVTVNSGGHFTPGNNSISSGFQTGALTLSAGSISDIRLGTTSATSTADADYFRTNDRTDVNGALALSGTLNLIDDANVSGLGSATAGSYRIFTQQGTATGAYQAVNNISGYHAAVDTSTDGSVYVNNYQIAVASDVTAPVHLKTVHVGETFTSSTLSITNTATSNGYAEGLNANKGAVTGNASVGGTNIISLAGGATGNSLTVGLGGSTNTGTAGVKTGTVTVGFTSDGTISGYGTTTLASQTVTVDGQVNQYAKPTYTQVSGAGALTGSGTSYTFNLGTFNQGSGTYTGLIALNNVLVDAQYQDLLNGTFTLTGQADKFILSGLDNLTDIGIGLSHNLSIGFDSGSQANGIYIGHILFNPTSVNADTPESLPQIDMTLEFQVVPEPATWGMVLSGFGMLLGIQRLRRNRVGIR